MRFLNFNKVLCLSPHPDDVEVGMMGSVIKHPDTHFDILCLTRGGAKGFDDTNELDRRGEVYSVWSKTDCSNIGLYDSKFDYLLDLKTRSSTRRFLALFSFVVLGTMGRSSPNPLVTKRVLSIFCSSYIS